MKTAEPTAATKPAPTPPNITLSRASSSKVLPGHLEKLAVVYVRQSSPKQVLDHRESTARQYAFADQAVAFGWPRERVLTIDEDLGKSGRTAEGRSGFQRLITEVTLNHVGMVLGLEMSRLARSSKDWHAFFEMCAIFGTLIADEDGVYDGNDPNDRLLLGLKGIMSEMELHIMRNRLERGRDCKAQRGELFFGVPVGYVLLPTGEVDFDPDEQAQEVMRLVFDKFDELGTIYGLFHWLIRNNIRLPIRPQSGAKKGQLDWRRPSICTLAEILRHPIYAGAYSFGRRPADPKRTFSPKGHSRPLVPMEQWKVLHRDRLPAYITWEHYLRNRERIEQNRNRFDCQGAPRSGVALLSGLLVCGTCGRRMRTLYHAHGKAQYDCNRRELTGLEPRCPGLAARAVDGLVAQQVLRALEPAAVELSIQNPCGRRAGAPAPRQALAATAAAGALRGRVSGAPLPGGRSRKPPGGGHSGKALGRVTRPGKAAPGRVRPLPPANAGQLEPGGAGTSYRPHIRHPCLVACPGHDQRRSEADRALPGGTGDRVRACRQRGRGGDDSLGGRTREPA